MFFGRHVRSGLAVFTAGFMVAGCAGLLSKIQPSQTQVAQPQTTQATSPNPPATAESRTSYPANVVQNFMNACIQSGGSQEACSCILNKIQNRYSLQEFSQVEQQSKATGEMPQEISDFIAACRSQ